jgi:hypothetical protein
MPQSIMTWMGMVFATDQLTVIRIMTQTVYCLGPCKTWMEMESDSLVALRTMEMESDSLVALKTMEMESDSLVALRTMEMESDSLVALKTMEMESDSLVALKTMEMESDSLVALRTTERAFGLLPASGDRVKMTADRLSSSAFPNCQCQPD